MLFELPEDIKTMGDIIEKSKTQEERIELLALFAEKQVGHAIFLIDDAIAAWEQAGRKPPAMQTKMEVLQSFHRNFTAWQKNSVFARSSGDLVELRKNLENFMRLCKLFEKKTGLMNG